jgi:hypothetical protein
VKVGDSVEVLAGTATLLSAMLAEYFVYFPEIDGLKDLGYSLPEILFRSLLALLIPALLIATGSFLHAIKKSIVGFGLLFVFGVWLTFTHWYFFALGAANTAHPFIGLSPGFFALFTIILAFVNIALSFAKPERPR